MATSKVNINVLVSVNGFRNSGKTLVLTNIIEALRERGFTVELQSSDDPYKERISVRKAIENGDLQS